LARAESVPEDRKKDLAEALRFNELLFTAYYLKKDLRKLWSQLDHKFGSNGFWRVESLY